MKRLIRFDWAIKKILRDKANFEILEGFLSELLKTDLKIEAILESEGNKDDKDDKFNRVDLLVKNTQGNLILIEVQNEHELDYLQRVLFGTSKLVTEYIKETELYREIKKIISISIVYFNLGHGEDYIYYGSTTFKGVHKDDELQLTKRQKKVFMSETISTLYPEYYLIETNRFNDILNDRFDEWVYFLKNGEINDDFRAKGIQLASKRLEVMHMNIEKRKEYERYLENLRYKASLVDSSYGEGHAAGEEIGIKKGEEIGIKKGEEIGAENTKKEIALNMLQADVDPEIILKTTGLSIDEINNL